MRDTEIVASIVAGDPKGLATAYDRHADPLFKYCRTLLSDPADAADAVQDTFVIAASRLDGLRDPERFRAWLYAVARNECRRIAASKKRMSALGEAPDVTDESVDVSERAGRAELRALFEDAAAGLNPGEREVIELQLRQGLEAGEVATVLGVSRNHAHTLLSRARSQLEACLGVLLVGRAGRDECGELSAMLAGWDGRLTVLLRKRVHRHIEHCATCTARRAFELRPVMLLDLSPGAALAAGAAESLRRAFGAPSGLKGHTIALATGHGPGAAAHSSTVLARAGTFGKQGFPRPAHAGKAGVAGHHGAGGVKALRSSPQRQAAVAAAVVIAVAIAAAAFALTGNNEHLAPSANPGPPHSAPPPPLPASAPAGPARGQPSPAHPARVSAARALSPTSSQPGPTAESTSPATAAAGHGPATTTSPPPGGTTTSPAPITTSPAPGGTATSPSPTISHKAPPPPPSPPPSAPPRPSTPPSPPPSPAPGTLSVLPDGGTMIVVPGLIGSLVSLRASGGTVNWSVSVANDPNHVVSVSPSTGTLTPASPAATLTITISQFVQCGLGASARCPTVTVSPGGATFSVWTGWILPFPLGGTAPPAATPASPALASPEPVSRAPASPAPLSSTSGGMPPAAPSHRITIR
jgi:RNA polymerase sigma factor (sigma-70 family)